MVLILVRLFILSNFAQQLEETAEFYLLYADVREHFCSLDLENEVSLENAARKIGDNHMALPFW